MSLLIIGEDLILCRGQHVSLVGVVMEITIKEIVNESQILNPQGTQRIAFTVRAVDMIR
jgi:hypothetical protein